MRRSTSRTGEIEVDPEPYSDNFERPARLLPVEAKALVAAIDLIGEHIPEGSLASGAREDRRGARRGPDGAGPAGRDRRRRRLGGRAAWSRRRSSSTVCSSSTTTRRTRTRLVAHGRAVRADERPRGLVRRVVRSRRATACATSASIGSSRAGDRRDVQPRPEVDPAAEVDGWLRTGEVQASRTRARVGLARARALGARGTARRRGAQRRRGRRRAELRRRRLARARDPAGGGRRGGARARRTRARRCARPRRASAMRRARRRVGVRPTDARSFSRRRAARKRGRGVV